MPSEDYLITERVRLRRFTAEDAPLLVELDSDPEVRKYVDMPHPPSLEDAARTIGNFLAWYDRDDKYGYWAAHSLARNGEPFMGWFHLRPCRTPPHDIELGYRLKKEFWGRGYATEVGKDLIARAFREFDVPKVIGIALAENQGSRRVMEKVGMHLEEEFQYDGRLPAMRYAMDRPAS